MKGKDVQLHTMRGRINRASVKWSFEISTYVLLLLTVLVLGSETALELSTNSVSKQDTTPTEMRVLSLEVIEVPYSRVGLFEMVTNAVTHVQGVFYGIPRHIGAYYEMVFLSTRIGNGDEGVTVVCPLNGTFYRKNSMNIIAQMNDSMNKSLHSVFATSCRIGKLSQYEEAFDEGYKFHINILKVVIVAQVSSSELLGRYIITNCLNVKRDTQALQCISTTECSSETGCNSKLNKCVLLAGAWIHVFTVCLTPANTKNYMSTLAQCKRLVTSTLC